MAVTPMPALYLSHGAPPLADHATWPDELAAWAKNLPRPKAILMISAHWEEAPLAIGATATVPLVYDFWGFPERYYQVTYKAPGAPGLASTIKKLLRSPATPVLDVPDRGLDHGAYVPLVEMYPAADVPVLQISMPSLDPVRLMEIGRKLAPLRDEGVLIVGSGSSFHNFAHFGAPEAEPFDQWLNDAVVLPAGERWSALAHWDDAPHARIAHGREEHLIPLMVAAGAGGDHPARTIFRSEVMGTPMSCWLFD